LVDILQFRGNRIKV